MWQIVRKEHIHMPVEYTSKREMQKYIVACCWNTALKRAKTLGCSFKKVSVVCRININKKWNMYEQSSESKYVQGTISRLTATSSKGNPLRFRNNVLRVHPSWNLNCQFNVLLVRRQLEWMPWIYNRCCCLSSQFFGKYNFLLSS